MNYLKHYIKLMRRNNTNKDTERHHIFPTSVYGKNNITVNLSVREHFVAHKLLYLIFKKRYGENHCNTKKMLHAARMMMYGFNRCQKITVTSYWYAKFRENNVERMRGKNNPVYKAGVGEKISKSKRGVPRQDMKGKAFFGSPNKDEIISKSQESKRINMERNLSETGRKVTYPKKRKSRLKTDVICNSIREGRSRTKQKFIDMNPEEFLNWFIIQPNKLDKRGGRNSNITRYIKARNETVEYYYEMLKEIIID